MGKSLTPVQTPPVFGKEFLRLRLYLLNVDERSFVFSSFNSDDY